MPCLACIDMTIYWHGKAWLSLLILFAYFFLFAFFQKLNDLLRRILLKDAAKVLLFDDMTEDKKVLTIFHRSPCRHKYCAHVFGLYQMYWLQTMYLLWDGEDDNHKPPST